MRSRSSQISPKTVLGVLGVALLASAATGCSSDVLRFQDGYYGSDQITTSSIPSNRNAAPEPQANIGSSRAALPSQQPTASQYPSGDRSMAQPFPAALPDNHQAGKHGAIYTGSIGSGQAEVRGSALPPPPAAPASRRAEATSARHAADGSRRVTLKHGETIYTLSRRYGVPADAIMRANGISSASDVTAGREIIVPAGDYSRASAPDASARHVGTADARPAPRPLEVPGRSGHVAMLSNGGKAEIGNARGGRTGAPGVSADASANGSYVVRSGDTLAGISRRMNVSIDALKRANNLSGSTIRIGQTLALPGGAAAPVKAAPTKEVVTGSVPKTPPAPKPEPAKVAAAAPKTAPQEQAPKSYTPPAGKQDGVAAAETDAKVASLTPQTSGIGKLRWPARGQIVSRFGSSEDGHRNDGIDISVPEGTPVKAAENGVVIYAGNGLKEYGNTVLIRHDDGLVTVYGYAKDIKVRRGDKVTRGEVIADSGMSGEANRPKLHFEVRKDATPVNPMTYLD